ncbi:MAG: phosphoribosyltransferase [Ruminococcaceae bacterium]|nr:phosphoribosyltransferase [Oscillospiraceae bacterium]
MPTLNHFKYETKRNNLFLRVVRGHFATSNAHSNYYIDVVAQKSRLSEAQAVADELSAYYFHSTVVDTILCLDGTEVIGACLAQKLSSADVINMNAHKSIYVVTPESINTSQLLFRENIIPMIAGKHVLILAVSVSTGRTVQAAIEAVRYYGGEVSGVASIFATTDACGGYPVKSVFNPNDLPDYATYAPGECPLCKQGQKLDALINCYGYSKL